MIADAGARPWPAGLPAATPAVTDVIGMQPRGCQLDHTEDFRGDITGRADNGFHSVPLYFPEPQPLSIRLIKGRHHGAAEPGALHGESEPALPRPQHNRPGLVAADPANPAEDRVTGSSIHDLL